MKKWTMSQLRRSWKVARHQQDRRPYRPSLESLESRVTPTNINITSFHYNPAINGQNLQETNLTPANVNPNSFGKLADHQVDGYTYAEPLYMANLMIGGTPHNVVFVATEHDSLYAFEVVASPNTPTGITLNQLWQRSFIDPANGITTVPTGDVGSGDITPEIGITGGGVIDPATNTLYLVAKTKEVRTDGNHYVQKLYAIDISSPTGANKTAPYTIGDSHGGDGYANQTSVIHVAGAGSDSSGGDIKFDAFSNNQRPSLQLLNGRVYVGWSSHGDQHNYHGWVVGFNETTLQPEKWFNATPNAKAAGLWQSEGAISTDGTYLYFAVGNSFSGPNPGFDPAHGNYSESVIKLDTRGTGTDLPVTDYFTPFNWQSLDNSDADLGSGGVMLLPDSVGSTAHPHLMVETGKDGHIYLLDRDNLGKFNPNNNSQIVQDLVAGPGGVWGNPAFYQESATSGLLIYHGSGSDTREFRITNGQIQQISTGNYIAYRSNQGFGFPGAQPIITSNGADNTTALDFELQSDNYGTQGPEELHVYMTRPAASSGTMPELYNSNMTGLRDKLAGSVKFTSSIVSNGWVFVGQEYNFSVFGLFPTHTAVSAAPTGLMGMGISPTSIQINWTSPSPNTATGIKIFRSTDGTNFTLLTTVSATTTTYTDTGLAQTGTYYYRVAATNQAGDSATSNTVMLTPLIAAPTLSIDNISSVKVSLVWTQPSVAKDHYSVERSTDPTFGTFTTVAMNIPGNTLSYVDNNSTAGQYYYRVRAFTAPSGGSFALSNVVAVKIGAGSQTIDYFQSLTFPPNPPDLQANGDAQFAEGTARLVHQNNVAGSVFSVNEKNVLNFDNEFNIRLHEGTQPNYANGLAFVIQAISPNALGLGGQGLGYQGIPESVAIKFDTNTGGSENGTGGSTGLFFGGDQPTVAHQPGEVNIMLDATKVNLESQSIKQIEISYAYNPANPGASVLHEEIVDADHPTTPFTHDYTVDIPSLLGLATSGNTIAYVGFTASTGSNNYWELEDVTSWRYLPTGPAAPHNLTVVSGTNTNSLAWKATSADELGYYVERSTNSTSGFTRIQTLPAGTWSYTDTVTGNPQQYYYRVQAFNRDTMMNEQDSGYSNVATGAGVSIAFPNFATHPGLSANTNGVMTPAQVFPGTPPVMRLTDGRNSEASSSFDSTIVGTGAFTTTFTLQDHPNAGAADDLLFVLQNDPRGTAALGDSGGHAGYFGITHSVAIKFDLYTGGSHNPTTGLFTNGQSPATNDQVPAGSQDVPLTGINLGSGDSIQVTLTYDGATLTEMVRDTVTGATVTHAYTVNITQVIGGNIAYVGFTAGTGGENATQDILNWTGQFAQAPAQLTAFMVSAPATATAGVPFAVTITAKDQNGNTFTGYTGTVHFASNDTQAVLPANYTFTAADMGVHTFMGVVLKTAGNHTITATDTAKATVTGTATIAVSAAAATTLTVSGFPGIIRPGTPGTFTVAAKDAFGNTVTGYRGVIHFTSSDSRAMLPADYTFTAADNGSHVFMATLNTTGPQSITATDTMTATITGTQSGIMVQLTGSTVIDFSGGFANHGNLTTNGNATFPANTTVLRLTDGGTSEGSTAFYNTLIGPGQFSTTFTIQDQPVTGMADGITFIIQNDPRGPAALGAGGGGEGYAGIVNSIAIKLDLYTHGTHNPSTGLFTGGQSPDSDTTKDVAITGINLGSHDPIQVALSYDGTNLTEVLTDTTTHATFTHTYMGINLANILGGNAAFVGFGGGTGGETAIQDVVNWTGQFQQAGGVAFTFSNFTTHTNIIANTQSMVPGLNVFPGTPPVMRLTDGRNSEGTTAFYGTAIGTGTFTTTFVLQDQPNNGAADGITFIIQGDPRGPAALGNGGGGLGYAGITNSIAVQFDLYGHGTHNPLTGLFSGGESPDSDSAKDVPLTGINLGSHDPIQVVLSYDGANLTEMVTDMTTHAMFSHTYTGVNLAQLIGGNAAYVGFGAGTGGENATQDIVSWSGSFSQPQAAKFVVSAPTNASAGTPVQVTVSAVDQNGLPLTNYIGLVHFTSSDAAAILPANYTFMAGNNGTQTFTVIFNTPGSQSITVTDTTTATITGTQTGITVKPGTFVTVDYSNGFGNPTNLTHNGTATFVGPNGSAVGSLAGHMDITDTALSPTGSASFNATTGAYTLTASGADIWNGADEMHYLYEPLVGNGTIVARLLSASAPDFWTKAGLMIRTDLTPGSANDFMLDTPNTGHQEPVMQFRDTAGGGTADTGNHGTSTTPNVPTPIWLKLVRVGNNFYGYYAADVNGSPGVWNLLATHTTAMPTTVYVGLALTAHTSATGPAGSATFDHVSVTGAIGTLTPAVAQLTDGGTGEAGSIYYNNKVNITSFTTTFTLQDTPKTGAADGLSFVIQNDPRGVTALGPSGGAEGYGGVNNSIAIKFDLYGHGTHNPLTGLFTNGQDPSQFPNQDVALTGINLGSGHLLQITLSYNGTTLTETVVDTVTHATFTHDYLINIAQTVGGTTAYVGFSGGTGGETAVQTVTTWTGTFPTAASTVASLGVSPALTTATAGTPVSITVTALDPGGHRIGSYTGTVHFTSTDPQAVLPADYTFTAADNGQHVFMVTLKTAGNQAVFITDAANNLATLAGIVVNPAAASALLVSDFPSPVAAGTSGAVKVTAVDPYGNVATGYRGTVHLTSSDPQAVLEGNHTFTAGDNGSYAFAATLFTAGTQSITATDTTTATITGTQSGIVVTAGAAQTLVVGGFPSPIQAGTPGNITVTAYDAYGNVAGGYTGTVSFYSSDPQAALPANYTFTAADMGSHTFSATLFTAGLQLIGAFDVNNGSLLGEQDNIVVTAGPVSMFAVTGFPSPVAAGTPGTFTVTAEDAYGNVVTNFTDRISFYSTDSRASLPPSYQFTVGDHGSHTFTATLFTAGSQSIGAIDVNNPGVVGAQDGIQVTPLEAVALVVSGFPSPIQAGMSAPFSVTAVDQYGNVATDYTGTVKLSSSDPDAQFVPAVYTYTSGDAGTHVFTATLFTRGKQKIAAKDVNNHTIRGKEGHIKVTTGGGSPQVADGADATLAQGMVVDQYATPAPVVTEVGMTSSTWANHPPLFQTTSGSAVPTADRGDGLETRLEAVDLVLANWDGGLLHDDLL